ncbi:hypothetical protein ACJIZ3_018326 [Penstemon smallii]|uniref:F-box domain-containing protein n=1 Tax=Penstemon smallii TaxID=265156 RepID=A0ABD3SY25_9LAMI
MAFNEEENVFSDIRCFNEKSLDKEKKDIVNCEGSGSDEGCEDIVDLLPNDPFSMEFNLGFPSDPFGMDVNTSLPKYPFGMDFKLEATIEVFSDIIGDIGLNNCGFESHEAYEEKKLDENKYYAEVNLVWASSVKFEEEDGEIEVVDNGLVENSEDVSYGYNNMLGENMEDLMCFGCEKYQKEKVKIHEDSKGGEPNDALFFALGYLEVKDLLSVEMVCKSLRNAVQNDPLLWRSIYIEDPSNYKITDDNLMRLTNRAQGTLHTLSLERCLKITNSGLKHVFESNPRLTKLSVTGCTKLNLECLLHDVKVFNSIAKPGIKHLRIGEIVDATNQLVNDFKIVLGAANEDKKCSNYKPRYHCPGEIYLSLDDERVIDVEMCPKCQKMRQVYDCPIDSCQAKPGAIQTCRGCKLCIARCINCGCCLENKDYEETFSYDLMCLDCFSEIIKCKDRMSFSHENTSYHFFLCG